MCVSFCPTSKLVNTLSHNCINCEFAVKIASEHECFEIQTSQIAFRSETTFSWTAEGTNVEIQSDTHARWKRMNFLLKAFFDKRDMNQEVPPDMGSWQPLSGGAFQSSPGKTLFASRSVRFVIHHTSCVAFLSAQRKFLTRRNKFQVWKVPHAPVAHTQFTENSRLDLFVCAMFGETGSPPSVHVDKVPVSFQSWRLTQTRGHFQEWNVSWRVTDLPEMRSTTSTRVKYCRRSTSVFVLSHDRPGAHTEPLPSVTKCPIETK